MSRDEVYLRHILDAIRSIESYIEGGRDAFLASSMQQDAVVRQLEVIGEAVKQLSAEVRDQRPEIPWRDIAGMRDVLIHAYFSVDLEQVWEVTQRELQKLKSVVKEILNQE